LVTIRLRAAWRNTSVSRTTDTAPLAMMSASTCPGPDRGQLVDVAHEDQRRPARAPP
jgi:hypothetical protein